AEWCVAARSSHAVRWPVETSEALSDWRRDFAPAAVLESVNDPAADSWRDPAVRPGCTHKRRQIVAPLTAVFADGMTAAIAAGVRKLPDSRQAVTAHDSAIT